MEHGATATEGHFDRQLDWRGGVFLALVVPMGAFTLVGLSIGPLGAWGALLIWGSASLIALAQNFIFAELAGMFPDKPGGIAMYAHEAWKRYLTPIGAVAAFGYWAGWSLTLAVVSLIVGQLVQTEWFPHLTQTVSVGSAHVGLPHLIAAGTILLVYVLNVEGVKPVVRANRWIGYALAALAAVCLLGPIVTGHVDTAQLHLTLGSDSVKVGIVWLFIVSWTAYGTEMCATFAPEYRNPQRDTHRALLISSMMVIGTAALSTIVLTGAVGQDAINSNPLTFYTGVVAKVFGTTAFSSIVIAILCLAQLIAMSSATADSGRALYALAHEGLTVRQLDHLNKRGMPSRAMAVDVVINIAILFLIGNVTGIIFASNLGYLVAVFFALTGFVLLRRDQPDAPRPVRRSAVWIPIALLLAALNAVIVVVGYLNPALGGYGGRTEQIIAIAILAAALVLYAFRKLVQDRARPARHDIEEPTPSRDAVS